MFTGIITSLGRLESVAFAGERDAEKVMVFSVDDTVASQLAQGDSIAVNGVCSTAVFPKILGPNLFQVSYLKETLLKTTLGQLQVGDWVHLELSLRPTDRISGHFVTGHVDAVGVVRRFEVSNDFGEMDIAYPPEFSRYLVSKGSIAVDGVSLTVVTVTPELFSCHLIPHTIEQTTFNEIAEGKRTMVNLEFDILAKYVQKQS